MLSRNAFRAVGGFAFAALAAGAQAQTTAVVVPGANASVEGPSSSTIPFAFGGTGVGRYQQVFDEAELPAGPVWLTGIAFRANGNTALVGRTLTVSIAVSTATAGPDGLSATFATNVGSDATVVYAGTLDLPPVAAAPGPSPFGWTIPFQAAYLRTSGPVLFDLTITASTGGSGGTLDAVNATGDAVSRVYHSSDPASPTGSTAPSTLGLVAEWSTVPAATPLASSEATISAASGGTERFFLQAGTANAGHGFLLVGGISGSSPGTTLPGGLVLPVNADSATIAMLESANSPGLQNFHGTLDANGRAIATAVVPPGLGPATVGTSFSFAFLLLNPIDFVSNPVALAIAP